jgi:hypothetical protein
MTQIEIFEQEAKFRFHILGLYIILGSTGLIGGPYPGGPFIRGRWPVGSIPGGPIPGGPIPGGTLPGGRMPGCPMPGGIIPGGPILRGITPGGGILTPPCGTPAVCNFPALNAAVVSSIKRWA